MERQDSRSFNRVLPLVRRMLRLSTLPRLISVPPRRPFTSFSSILWRGTSPRSPRIIGVARSPTRFPGQAVGQDTTSGREKYGRSDDKDDDDDVLAFLRLFLELGGVLFRGRFATVTGADSGGSRA